MIRHYIFDKTTDNGETLHCVKAVMPNCENDAINLIKKHTRGNAVSYTHLTLPTTYTV